MHGAGTTSCCGIPTSARDDGGKPMDKKREAAVCSAADERGKGPKRGSPTLLLPLSSPCPSPPSFAFPPVELLKGHPRLIPRYPRPLPGEHALSDNTSPLPSFLPRTPQFTRERAPLSRHSRAPRSGARTGTPSRPSTRGPSSDRTPSRPSLRTPRTPSPTNAPSRATDRNPCSDGA